MHVAMLIRIMKQPLVILLKLYSIPIRGLVHLSYVVIHIHYLNFTETHIEEDQRNALVALFYGQYSINNSYLKPNEKTGYTCVICMLTLISSFLIALVV